MRFPADWHTNSGDVATACSYFHPSPFELPERQEVVGIAIHVSREPVAFERVVRPGPAQRVLEREEVRVGGRPAERLSVEATGEALLPEGTESYRYVVDLGDETLVASTHDVGDLRFERNRDVLDRMMERLELRMSP